MKGAGSTRMAKKSFIVVFALLRKHYSQENQNLKMPDGKTDRGCVSILQRLHGSGIGSVLADTKTELRVIGNRTFGRGQPLHTATTSLSGMTRFDQCPRCFLSYHRRIVEHPAVLQSEHNNQLGDQLFVEPYFVSGRNRQRSNERTIRNECLENILSRKRYWTLKSDDHQKYYSALRRNQSESVKSVKTAAFIAPNAYLGEI
uniref:Uncharacterized protein n=1 Tax=Romanomermis culicivorax TaxID=13658 RepID=A0A915K5U3_ROMCU